MKQIISERTRKNMNRWVAPVRFTVSLLFTAVLIMLCDIYGMSDLPYRSTFNLGADIVSMGVCTVLLYSLMQDKEGVSDYTRTFVLLISATSTVLFSDACCWLVDEEPALRELNIIVNVFNFLSAAFLIFYLLMYVFNALQLGGRVMNIAKTLMAVLLVPNSVGCLVNLFASLFQC